MATAELQELVRKDPSQRTAAWAEIKYRNQARQAFEGENGQRPLLATTKVFKHITKIEVMGHEITTFEGGGPEVEPWVPPDLTPGG